MFSFVIYNLLYSILTIFEGVRNLNHIIKLIKWWYNNAFVIIDFPHSKTNMLCDARDSLSGRLRQYRRKYIVIFYFDGYLGTNELELWSLDHVNN